MRQSIGRKLAMPAILSPLQAPALALCFMPLLLQSALGEGTNWWPNFPGLIDNGQNELLLSGYTWHDPLTYGATDRARFNDYSWGGGYARYHTNTDGSTEMLSAQALSDSYNKPQFIATYSRYWSISLFDNVSVGGGYAAGLSQRSDALRGIPEPIALPIGVITIANRVQIFATYIPPLPYALGVRGDVALIFAGIRF